MKRFSTFFAVLLFSAAWAASGMETEIGFPGQFKSWRYFATYAEGSFCQTEKLGLPCAMLQAYFSRELTHHGETVILARSVSNVKGKFKGIKVKAFAPDVAYILVRFIDGTGQTFQYHYKLADGFDWQTLLCTPATHDKKWLVNVWGGARDKVWHEPLRGVQILLDQVQGCYYRPSRAPKLYLNSVKLITE